MLKYKSGCEEAAKIEAADKAKKLRAKVKRKAWDPEPDGLCQGKGLPPYRFMYEGGTFAEDAEVAKADGCTPLYQVEDRFYCCPKGP